MIRSWTIRGLLALFVIVSGAAGVWLLWPGESLRVDKPVAGMEALSFTDIPGWAEDDHAAALAAFRRSCETMMQGGAGNFRHACATALALPESVAAAEARAFFERHFVPRRYPGADISGFVTSYFEPELSGSRERTERFSVPVYGKPDDLAQHASGGNAAPYPDRRAIEQGALEGRGLELFYLESWVDAFFMHVQGSARIALAGGGHTRIGFAAKNGHPYTAIGKVLIERGAIARKDMSMQAIRAWLERHPDEGRAVMWENRSYIFFRELPETAAAPGPLGAQGVALTPGRSLAVDTGIHALGTPVWVASPALDVHGERGFRRLMIAQDAGSAIKGAERGDIFWGSGAEAGAVAGTTQHAARFTILVPRLERPGA